MTPEEKSLLERTYKLAEENNEILKSIRRTSRLSLIMRGIYWGFILLAAFGAYYFIQPYVETVMGMGSNITGMTGGVTGDFGSIKSTADLLKDLLK